MFIYNRSPYILTTNTIAKLFGYLNKCAKSQQFQAIPFWLEFFISYLFHIYSGKNYLQFMHLLNYSERLF